MTEAEWLFIHTLDDLQTRVRTNDAYQLLGTSALLRKLLFEQHTLIAAANAAHRIKLRFRVAVQSEEYAVPPMISVSLDGIDSEDPIPGSEIRELTQDQLGKFPVAVIRGDPLTVSDVVLYEANVGGGVHLGTPDSTQQKVAELAAWMQVDGVRATAFQLRGITRVVLRGLAPLASAILVAQAQSQIDEALVMETAGNADRAREMLWRVVQQFAQSEDPAVKGLAARAMLDIGRILKETGHLPEAFDAFQSLADGLAGAPDVSLRDLAGQALGLAGRLLVQMDKLADAIKLANRLLELVPESDKSELQAETAWATELIRQSRDSGSGAQ